MTVENQTAAPSNEQLRRDVQRAVLVGRFEDALRLCDDALVLARRADDQKAVDLALCNRCAVAITLGDCESVRAPLRDVLLRSSCTETAFLAADNLSRSYEQTKDFKKGLFYAKAASNHARSADDPAWLAASYNQRGNCLLGDSYFPEAAEAYRRALALLPEEPSATRAALFQNLGYCLSVMGEHREAFRLSFRSLRWLRRAGALTYVPWSHLDLCHAYVQIGRARHARRHGEIALRMGEENGDVDLIKNSLFMLGETESLAGDLDAAWKYFSRLQRAYYPETPQLAALMLGVDMRPMINLRA